MSRGQRAVLVVHEWAYAVGAAAGLVVAVAVGGIAPAWFGTVAMAAGFASGFVLRRATRATAALVRRVSLTVAYFDGAPHRIESEGNRYEWASARMRELAAALSEGRIDRREFDDGWREVYERLPDRGTAPMARRRRTHAS
jgi:hypothetical protein